MKTTKRLLSVLLALALGLALFAPMAAATDPVITGITPQNQIARTGKKITLTVEAQLPAGAVGPLTYQWYQWSDGEWQAIEGAQAKSMTVTTAIDEFVSADIDASVRNLMSGITQYYQVVVSCGEGQTAQNVSVKFVPTFGDGFSGVIKCAQAYATANTSSDVNSPTWDQNLRYGTILAAIFASPVLLYSGMMIWFFSGMTYYGILK